MDKIKEIERRLIIGYTMSVYGNNAGIHEQMTNDIKTLLEAINHTRCCKSDSEQLFCEEPETATYRELHFNECDICKRPIKRTK